MLLSCLGINKSSYDQLKGNFTFVVAFVIIVLKEIVPSHNHKQQATRNKQKQLKSFQSKEKNTKKKNNKTCK